MQPAPKQPVTPTARTVSSPGATSKKQKSSDIHGEDDEEINERLLNGDRSSSNDLSALSTMSELRAVKVSY